MDLNRILLDNIRERRQEPRWARLEALWDIIKADFVQPAKAESMLKTLSAEALEVLSIEPIPEFSDALEWPIIKRLLNTVRPISEMEALFVQERSTIDREVSAWRARIKTSLVDVVRKSLVENRCMPQAPTVIAINEHPSDNPLRDIPLEMQLLLRADTLFVSNASNYLDYSRLPFCNYETYMRELRRWIGYKSDEHWRLVHGSRFRLHPTAPVIARALLDALGRPFHTTIVELEALGKRFVCGRCDDEKPKTWLEIVSQPSVPTTVIAT